MLSLGHVHIRREELVSVSWGEKELTLEIDWPDNDIPILFDVAENSSLHFNHLAAWNGGLPVQVAGWRAVPRGNKGLHITLSLAFTSSIASDSRSR